MSAQVAACSQAFGKIQPQLGVLRIVSGPVVAAFLVGQIGEHGAPQFAFFETHAEFRQIGGEGVYMVVVIPRIVAKIVARQLARAPGPVKGMAKQIERRDARVQLLEKFWVVIILASVWCAPNIRASLLTRNPTDCDGRHRTARALHVA